MNERPLRILHLVAGSDAGGVSRYLLDLCTAMRAQGHDVTIAGERGAWHAKFEAAGLPWIEIPAKGGLLAQWKAAATLRAFLDAHPVDVLHAHYRRATLLGRRLQKRVRVPLLYTLHLSHMPMTWGRRWLSDFGDHVHVASRQAERWLMEEKLADADRITYIPHGIDPEHYPLASEADRATARTRFNLPADAIVAAYVGRLDWPKNEDWLVDVIERVPNAHALMAGDGPHMRILPRFIEDRGVDPSRIHLLGDLADPLPVYQAADAVLLPSQREGFSYVNAEAMSVGTPMLRTATSGAEDLIVQGVTGRYVAIDRGTFVSAAVEFLSNREMLGRMGRAGAERVRQHFTLDRQVRATIELYRSLRNDRARP